MKRVVTFAVVCFTFLSAAVAGEAHVRALHALLDFDAIVREVASEPLPTVIERALYANALARLGAGGRATSEAANLREAHPADAWSWYAVTVTAESPRDALAASEKMMALAGGHPEADFVRARVRALSDSGKRDEALKLLDAQPRTAPLLVTRVQLLTAGRSANEIDPQVFALLDEARKLEPENVEALYQAASLARYQGRLTDALPLLVKAAPLTNAVRVQREYWGALRAVPNSGDVRAAIEALIARDPNPGVLRLAAAAYEELGEKEKRAQLEARILREAPASLDAQWVLTEAYARAMREGGDRLAAARAAVAWPQQFDPLLLANGYRNLFFALREDPKATDAELLAAIHGMHPIARRSPASDFGEPALTLANRKLALDEAEKLAREGLIAVEVYIDSLRARGISGIDEVAPRQRAILHDALGWVLLQRGKQAEAAKELQAAAELNPQAPLTIYHRGRLLESQKKFSAAEAMYRSGLALPVRVNPNEEALKALYKRRHGSLKGYEASLEQVQSADASTRRKQALSERIKRPLPPFKLATLDGKTMTPDDLKGKIAVINFWGIWCGWCVQELPEFQQLVKKYAKDDKVAIVTLNNDNDPAKVRRWMAEHKYDFPVLLDDRFARLYVRGYPTTWFLDRSGAIAFEKLGATKALVEEFSWRIEALR